MTDIESEMYRLLAMSIASDYVRSIVDTLIDDVTEDVLTAADTLWNEDDVRLAIGRVLIERLGIER